MLHTFIIVSLFGYLTSLVLYVVSVSLRKAKVSEYATAVFAGALGAQTVSLLLLLLDQKGSILTNTGDFYFWVAWSFAIIFMVAGKRVRYPAIGACVSGMSVVLFVSSSLMAHETPAVTESISSLVLVFHVLPALLSEALLLFAFIVSVLFLLHERQLKKKSVNLTVSHGPSIDALETLNLRFVLWGFIAMSLAVISGSVWAISEHKSLIRSDVLEWSAYIAWILLAGILQARYQFHYSSRRVAQFTVLVVGIFFASLLLVLFTVGSSFHALY